ncbi:MAG: hypothetical protein COU85_02700 [Candidatus Portnoybacteria bacterium CG10_big_fil_rev_8_21_14_0_10_44_7]|uniref:Uncharacterized protein n=1 Tax=Candidatus Portnoybacteria bacterium CG10_big_fil_rev_8_21_14_0_10_44_7 TaxID=1974816 RepID=A0A2M8KI89_9BACT|nr:MAG: hypothetical protein COU85_02700 [Candidatus Portnoybacteria bacterium CG10_big_fil_rev_8_21_14_0_10_44_7]
MARPEKLTKESIRSQTKWAGVENALKEGTFSGYMMGVLETEKIFAQLLNKKRIPGRNVDAQIKYIRHYLSLPEKLAAARDVCRKITVDLNPAVSQQETQQAIAGYWQAIKDLEEALSDLSVKQKIVFQTKYARQKWLRFSKKSLIDIALFLLLILFLYDTSPGRALALRVGQGAHFFVFSIFLWIAAIAFGLIVLSYAWKLLNKKKSKL